MMFLKEGIFEAKSMIRDGAAIKHKSFGTGELEAFDGTFLVIRFSGFDAPKKFDLTSSLGNGFLTLDTPHFSPFIDKYRAVFRQAMRIPQQVKSAETALEPYAPYLD